ncbi:MAG: MGMT family protein [Proteobacteria bacterium]|nr:MGMT family protein [Pseudomonadota bacterium]
MRNSSYLCITSKRITKQKNSPQLLRVKNQIKKFLDKKIKKFKFKTKIFGSKKQIKVWNEIKKIHYAKTVSYNFISKRTKIHPRHVGKICSQNRLLLFIPCHRVIRSNGLLGGFSAKHGIDLKSKIIKIEELNK